jgi:gas vesicle protein
MDENNGQTFLTIFLSFLVGFVVGGLIGGTLALLFAPQSGEETRAAIRDKSIELKEQAAEQVAQVRAKAQEQINSLQAQLNELQEKQFGQQTPPAQNPPAS